MTTKNILFSVLILGSFVNHTLSEGKGFLEELSEEKENKEKEAIFIKRTPEQASNAIPRFLTLSDPVIIKYLALFGPESQPNVSEEDFEQLKKTILSQRICKYYMTRKTLAEFSNNQRAIDLLGEKEGQFDITEYHKEFEKVISNNESRFLNALYCPCLGRYRDRNSNQEGNIDGIIYNTKDPNLCDELASTLEKWSYALEDDWYQATCQRNNLDAHVREEIKLERIRKGLTNLSSEMQKQQSPITQDQQSLDRDTDTRSHNKSRYYL